MQAVVLLDYSRLRQASAAILIQEKKYYGMAIIETITIDI